MLCFDRGLVVCLVAALAGFQLHPSFGDDGAEDPIVMIERLRGTWVLEPQGDTAGEPTFRQRLELGPQHFVTWWDRLGTLPWDGAWFSDGGGKVRIIRYAPAAGRGHVVEELVFDFTLSDDDTRLSLTRAGKALHWRRSAAKSGQEPPRGPEPEEPPASSWSEESNGLRARLSMRRSHVSNGTGIVVTHLELHNVSDVGNPMLVAVHSQSMKLSVSDADGRDVPMTGGAFSGPDFGTPELVLPHDSSIRFRIGPRGWGIPADQAALVDLGSNFGWVLPPDGKRYYLRAVLEVAEAEDDRSERGIRWHGRLDLPRALIPTAPEPVDTAALGPLIDELGATMLGKDARASEAAVRELSLIDDPRVIPWYVKAVKTDSYALKFNALDRLSRLEGNDALEGLRVGMTTQGGDIGNTTTGAVAAASAENIRHQAAAALARSPHPQAKALLLSMQDDPAAAVRITVIQAAAQLETPESLALLKRLTEDGDPAVRGEAARLLKLRENGSVK